jgi:ribosomal protein S27AE
MFSGQYLKFPKGNKAPGDPGIPRHGRLRARLFMEAFATPMLKCPKCGAILDPASHGDLVFDGQVWCDRCHEYGRELIRPREIQEIESWCHMISTAFGFPPVHLENDANPAVYRLGSSVIMAEADHRQRSIRFYPPGCRLSTLCHELAHIYSGQDHSREWAEMFARLVAWVKTRLAEDQGPRGFRARLSIYAGVPQRVY